ncbi:helix-turn-helix domain-containing protein [Streptomyces bauhiniae]
MQVQKLNLTVLEAVEASGIGRSRLYQLIGEGELQSIKIGRRRYIPVASLQAYLDGLLVQQNQGRRAA